MRNPLAISKAIYQQLTAVVGEPAVAIRAWNGEVWGSEEARATIVLDHAGALRASFCRSVI